jgi:hypothetical protein
MRKSAKEQELADNARLLRAWKARHREELEGALAGPHGAMLERLVFILKGLELNSAPLLAAYVLGVDWATVDYLTRLVALHEINVAITYLRQRHGMSPFDDGVDVPNERKNMFQIIRGIVIGYETN